MSEAQKLTFVEIDVDRCSLIYGEPPCTAAIPATGDRKCFNGLGTCQDRDNFDNDPVTIRFAVDTSYLPPDVECIPCLTAVDFSPSTVSLGVDLGQRASIKIACVDHPDSDTGTYGDPYLADRSYNPFLQGTFFGKFRARNPYLNGRAMRLIRGQVGQALGDMETRHFIIESFNGPLPDGSFAITAKDVLKLADGDRAQAPVLSNGFLQAAIDADDMAFTLSPAGIGNDEYPASGTLAIGGKEIVTFTRSGDAVTITARAQYNTEAVTHEAQDRAQMCLVYDGEDPADIIAGLLENYAGVDGGYIPIDDWRAETGAYLQRLYTGCVAEPVAVSTLLKELIEQAALALAWDDEARVIRLQVLRGILTNARRFNEDNCVEGSIEVKEQPEKRVSRVWTYFGIINPLRPIDQTDNYRSSAETYDERSEHDYGSPAIKKVFSRWIPEFGRNVAERLNAIQIARYKIPPRRFGLDLWRDGQFQPKLLDGARVEAWFLQDDTGAGTDVPIQVIRLNPLPERYKIEAEEMRFDVPADFNDRIITIDVSTLNFDMRAAYDDLYPSPTNGTEVIVRVAAGAIVGSVSAAQAAFDVGSWPTQAATGNRTSGSPVLTGLSIDAADLAVGMTVAGTGIPVRAKILSIDSPSQITLDKNATSGAGTSTALTIYTVLLRVQIAGRIQGAGGEGGAGGTLSPTAPGSPGGQGGVALYARYPVAVEDDGEVWGGGGGGGGASGGYRTTSPYDWISGGQGGGGQGDRPGIGGSVPATSEAAGVGINSGGGGYGGTGGGAGANGDAGQAVGGGTSGAGGAAGAAIDGDSFVTEVDSADVHGPRVN
jgi:hypothetical protein